MSAFDDNFAYALVSSSDRTLKITGVNPSKYNSGNLSWGSIPAIPALYAGGTLTYNGYGTLENAFAVVEIANGAFNGRTEFAEGPLVLPNSLLRIGDNAFNGVKLSGRLTIPASVTSIGANAFANTLIDELVVENASMTDLLSGVVDATRVTSKETDARVATDTSLNALKVPKANPIFTGTTTIPIAETSIMTVTNATVQAANVTTAKVTNSTSIDYYEANVSEKNRNARFRVLTAAGNSLSVGGVSENAAAIEVTLPDGIYRTGATLVAGLLTALNSKNIAWIGGQTIAWSNTAFDDNANAIKLGYTTAAPASIDNPSIVIRTKFVSNGVSYDSSRVLGAMGATVGAGYEDGAFILTYGNRTGLNFPQPINLNTPTLTVNGATTLEGDGTVSSNWNFGANKPTFNAQVLATESFTQSKIKLINGSSILSTVQTLADVASAIGADPQFAANVQASQSTIIQSIVSLSTQRSTDVSALSSALSVQMSALQSSDVVLSSAISSTVPVRVSQLESVSTVLQTVASQMQSADVSTSTVLSGATSTRTSQLVSLNAAISTATSLLQNADTALSTSLSTATLTRSLNISTNSSTWAAHVAALETADASLSTAIAGTTPARSDAVSSLSSVVSTAVPVLESGNNTFSTALSNHTVARVDSVATLSGAISTQVATTQGLNAGIMPQITGAASVAPNATTNTVFNLLGINVNDSLTFRMSGGSGGFTPSARIVISYSPTDYLKGTVTAVAGSDITFTVNQKVTAATESTVYSTTGSFGVSAASSTGSHVVPLTTPAFVAGSNFVVTSMTGALFSSTHSNQYTVSLLDASDAVIATAPSKLFTAAQTMQTHAFTTALVLKGASNLKQKFSHVAGASTQIIVNFTDYGAYTTIKGYAVDYSSGVVHIESNGALQSTRISAIGALSTGAVGQVNSLSTVISNNQSGIISQMGERSASVSSVASTTAQSGVSLQTVTSTHGSAITVAVSQRNSNVLSLSSAIDSGVSVRASDATSISAALSAQIVNRSSQVLTAVTSLVGAAPASLDTLFEIAATLDAGPALYSIISATESTAASNTAARSTALSAISASLSVAASTLQVANASLSTGISTAGSNQVSRVASVSGQLSAFISSARSTQATTSDGISTAVSLRGSGVTSISASLSTMASVLQSPVLSTGISAAISARQSGVSSASVVLSTAVAGFQTVDAGLSSSVAAAALARQTSVVSVSTLLSSTVSGQGQAIASLSTARSALSAGINLSALANVTDVDTAIGQVVGVGAVSALDTLNEIATTLNNNATVGTTLTTLLNTKATQSDIAALNSEVLLKVNQADLSQLVSTAETKANNTAVSQMQTSVSSIASVANSILSQVQTLQTNVAANSQIIGLFDTTIRQIDSLFEYSGSVNADGSINYAVNKLSNMVLKSSALAFTVNPTTYAVSKVTQVAVMQFDPTQVGAKYTSRGVEYTVNPMPLTIASNAYIYTFNVDSNSVADYTSNATDIVITANPTTLRAAPLNSPFTVPKLAISSYTYATPTVETPYAATTWSDVTGKITQVLRINFESGVQNLLVDGTVYAVAGTTQRVHTLEYLPGAAGTLVIKALNSATKLESAELSLSNVYNDYPQHAVPTEVGGSKSVSVSGSTYTYVATYATTASMVEVYDYDVQTTSYSAAVSVSVVSGQVTITRTYAVGQIGQVLFRLRAKTGDNKRYSDYIVANAEAITFTKPVQSSLSYTTLSPGSYRMTATYTVHPLASAVKVINPTTSGTYIASQAASGGSVTFNIDFTEEQSISIAVITLANAYGLQSVASDVFVPIGQYDPPVYVADSKEITLSGATYSYSAKYTSASPDGIIIYDADGVTNVGSSTGTSPFTVVTTYSAAKIGQTAALLSSKGTAAKRESARTTAIIGEDIPTHTAPVISGDITYGTSGANFTAQMNYSASSKVGALRVLNVDLTELQAGTTVQQSIVSTTGTTRQFSVTVTFSDSVSPLLVAVVAEANTYGKQSAGSTTQILRKKFIAPIFGSISYSGDTANMTYTVDDGVTNVQVRNASNNSELTTNMVLNGTTMSIQIEVLTTMDIVVVALDNSVGRESPASATQSLIKRFAAPIKASDPVYTTVSSGSSYTASMTYTVDTGVNAMQVRKASDNSVVSGVTSSVSGTTATITVPFTNVVSPFSFVVVALSNPAVGRESVVSATQTFLNVFTAPVKASEPVYATVSAGSYTAQITYTVATGVTAVQVRKASDNTTVSGVTSSVSGTTATITVPFTDAVAPFNFVVVALTSSAGLESAASALQTLIQEFATPVKASEPVYTTVSAGSYTASMTYTVTSGVSQVSAMRISDTVYSAYPSSVLGMGQTLPNFPTLGKMKTWTFTIHGSTGNAYLLHTSTFVTYVPIYIEVASSYTALFVYSGSAWINGEGTYNFHTLPRPLTFTISFDGNNFILRYGDGMTKVYANHLGITENQIRDTPVTTNISYNGLVTNYYPRWEMSIGFRSTGNNNAWRALIGDMYNDVNLAGTRGWGIWISNVNNIHFSWNGPTWDAPALTVAQNTDYVLMATKTSSSLTLVLRDVAANTTQTATNTGTASYIMSANGPVTVGGWKNNSNETFVGTISYVNVVPALASAIATGTSATITVPFVDAESPLNVKVIALANSVGRESGAATQTLLKQFTAPVKASEPVYTTVSAGSYTAQMTYTVDAGVNAVQVRKASDNSVVSDVTSSVSGTTATITVPFTNVVSPFSFAVVALSNPGVGRESVASATQTFLNVFTAPVKASEPVYTTVSAGSYTANMTYTVATGVTAVHVRKASDNTAVSGVTSSVSGTTATITVPFTDAVAPFNFVVVALTSSAGLESVASAAQTLLKQFAAPVKASEPVYTTVSSGSSYTANMTYTVAIGVTAVEVRQASDNTAVSGATSSVSGTTATITVPFTNVVSPFSFVVVALSNPGVGRESVASATQTFLNVFTAPVKASEPVYTTVSAGSYTANMTYTVATGVTAVQVRKASDNTAVSGVTSSVSGTTATITVPFTDAVSPFNIVVVALTSSAGLESVASAAQTLLKQFTAPVKASEPVYTTVSAGSYTAVMTYTVATGVTAVQVRKASDNTAVSGATSSVSGTTATITVPFTDAVSPFNIVVVALTSSAGLESVASAAQTLLKQFTAPVKASEPVYATVSAGSYTAQMTYTVATGVTAVQVRKASDNSVVSDVTSSVSGTTATITVPFTDAVAPFNFVVVALTSSAGLESAASATQTLVGAYAVPTVSGKSVTSSTILYSISNPPARYHAENFPYLGSMASWNMSVYFKITSGSGTYRALVASFYTNIDTSGRSWGAFIDSANNFFWAWKTGDIGTSMSVQNNVNYHLKITKTLSIIQFDLKNVDNGTSQTHTANHSNPSMGTNEPVSIGGWLTNAIDTGAVVSGVYIGSYSLAASYSTPSTAGINTYTSSDVLIGTVTTPGSGTFNATTPEYDGRQLGQAVMKVSAANDVTRHESAKLSVNGEDTPTYAAPVLSGAISYAGTSAAGYVANATYTVASNVNKVSVFTKAVGPIVTGIATQYQAIGYGIGSSGLYYGNWAYNTPGVSRAHYRLRFSNGVVSNLSIYSDSPQGLTNPNVGFALSDIPPGGVTAILQGRNNDFAGNVWYDVVNNSNGGAVHTIDVTPSTTTIVFSGTTHRFSSSPAILPAETPVVSSAVTTPGTITLAIPYSEADVNGGKKFYVVADADTKGKQSSASVSQSLIKQFAAPVKAREPVYTTVSAGSYTAELTYAVAAGVTAVEVRKASDNLVVSGATSSVSGTTATITVPFTDAVAPFNFVVVAQGNSAGRESAASVSQELLKRFAAPVKASEPVYTTVSAGSYTAQMTYTVAAGVAAVQVRKASDNTAVSGATSSISGTTATITVPFTNANSPLNIVVVALANSVGRESAASVSQTIDIPSFSAPVKASDPVYTTVSAGSYTAQMTYTVATGVAAVQVRKASDNTDVSGVTSSVSGTTATITVPFTNANSPLNIVVVALANSVGRESAASVSQTIDIPPFSAPVKASEPVYTTVSAGSYNAQMTYAVDSGVSQVSAMRTSETVYSVYPSGMGQTLPNFPTLGKMRTWSFTINGSTGFAGLFHTSTTATSPIGLTVGTYYTTVDTYSPGTTTYSESYLNIHTLPRPLTFTISFDGNNFIIRYGDGQTIVYANRLGLTQDQIRDTPGHNIVYNGLVTNYYPRWEMSIGFRSTGNNNAWRALIGDMYNNVNARGWGIWISSANNIHFSWNGPTWDAPALTVAQNTNYVLNIIKTPASMTMVLTNVDATTTQTATNTGTASYIMTANGPVTVGGWNNAGNENFVGTISYVNVVPALASAIATGTSATITVPFVDADSPLDVKVVALTNSVRKGSAASATQILLKQFAAPVKASEPVYTTVGAGSYTAQMTYTVAAGVAAVQVRKASDNSVVSDVTSSVSGTTATITVPFTDANSPLNIVVVALANSANSESAASVSQTFNIPQFAAPVKASEPVYTTVSAGSYTASMTYTVATGVTAVEVRKASDNTSVSGVTSSISGTTATITVPFTDAVSPLNIVVVALENPGVGRESAASVSQTFNIPQFAAPVKASEPVYTTVSAGSYTAEMTYTVAAGVTAVEVRKASDNTYVSGVSSTNGTTSIIVVPFTDADSPLIIVVVALGNSAGLESAASVSQTLKSPVGFPSVYTSRMNFSVPNGPNGVAVDGSGKIVVSCYFGNQLKVYNNQGSLQANIGSAGSSNGLFNAPSAIAIDKSGNIVVADSGNDRIQMFTIGGTHIRSFGSDGTGDGQFKYPNGIAVNSENHIIVTDSFKQTIPAIQSDLVKIFDNTGTFIRKFGSVGTGNGEFNGVIGVAVDKSDKIYVVDSGNYRVQVFDKYGTYISQKTFDRFPQVVTVDDTGKIFVALDNNVIVVHDSNWNYIDHFGYTGSNEFEFKFITGMTVDASGNLHVSERTNNSVKIIGATPQTFTGQLTEPLLISGPTYQNGNVKCTFEIEREVFGIKLSQYSETNKRWEPLLLVPTVTYDVTTYTTKTLVTVECPITQLQIGVSALATYTKTTSVTSAFFTLYRLSNNTTIRYFGNAAAVTSTPLFIQANFRGYTEWFAVVNQTMKTSIVNFFKGSTADAFFTAPGQSYPITKNNIVTTLMTSLSNLVYVTSFSGNLDSWDTSNVTNMGAMFKGSGNFNSDISKWDTSKVTNMQSMFFDAYYFNQNISGWNVDKVTNPVGWATFRTGSSLTDANTPPKFLT